MTTALVSSAGGSGDPPLQRDLEAVGITVVGECEAADLLPEALRLRPDLIVWFDSHPGDDLFAAAAAVEAAAPRPFVLFTNDPDAQRIDQAAQSGVHSYIISGYSLHRLRSVVKVAQARFRHIQLLKDELGDVNRRFEERKLVDRAKGILMGARQVREEEAFRILRTLSMRQKQRIGKVAEQVIASARYAEAVNLAGQLRMLSQRLVKLYALACAGVQQPDPVALLADSVQNIESNLQILSRSISLATFGDLFENVRTPWKALHAALREKPHLSELERIDTLAAELLTHAERLTTNLELAGVGASLHIINVSGRQRMLSQRLAKEALLAVLLSGPASEEAQRSISATEKTFVDALSYLAAMPLSTEGIRLELDGAGQAWTEFRVALTGVANSQGRDAVSLLSEVMLGHFDRLTDHYERSIQVLLA